MIIKVEKIYEKTIELSRFHSQCRFVKRTMYCLLGIVPLYIKYEILDG